jgi:hypothetical protein
VTTDVPVAPRTLDELLHQALAGRFGDGPSELRVSGSWLTLQRSHHVGREATYQNNVVCLRAGRSVGSCYVEASEVDQAAISACIGQSLGDLLAHPSLPIRVAALDVWLAEMLPHDAHASHTVTIPAGTSFEKSLFRARTVVGLLGDCNGRRIALIGVVNSLVQAIREQGGECLPCDFNVTHTEWGDPVTPHLDEVLEAADAVLATGMTLANGGFARLLKETRRRPLPLVVFAQTGSAIVPRFFGSGVSAVSAEPFPFFSLHGGSTNIYLYCSEAGLA